MAPYRGQISLGYVSKRLAAVRARPVARLPIVRLVAELAALARQPPQAQRRADRDPPAAGLVDRYDQRAAGAAAGPGRRRHLLQLGHTDHTQRARDLGQVALSDLYVAQLHGTPRLLEREHT